MAPGTRGAGLLDRSTPRARRIASRLAPRKAAPWRTSPSHGRQLARHRAASLDGQQPRWLFACF